MQFVRLAVSPAMSGTQAAAILAAKRDHAPRRWTAPVETRVYAAMESLIRARNAMEIQAHATMTILAQSIFARMDVAAGISLWSASRQADVIPRSAIKTRDNAKRNRTATQTPARCAMSRREAVLIPAPPTAKSATGKVNAARAHVKIARPAKAVPVSTCAIRIIANRARTARAKPTNPFSPKTAARYLHSPAPTRTLLMAAAVCRATIAGTSTRNALQTRSQSVV